MIERFSGVGDNDYSDEWVAHAYDQQAGTLVMTTGEGAFDAAQRVLTEIQNAQTMSEHLRRKKEVSKRMGHAVDHAFRPFDGDVLAVQVEKDNLYVVRRGLGLRVLVAEYLRFGSKPLVGLDNYRSGEAHRVVTASHKQWPGTVVAYTGGSVNWHDTPADKIAERLSGYWRDGFPDIDAEALAQTADRIDPAVVVAHVPRL